MAINIQATDKVKSKQYYHSIPNDYAVVTALPDDWTPQRGGPLLQKYLLQRSQKHDQTVADMLAAAAVINKNFEQRVEALTEALQAEFKLHDINIQCIIDQYAIETKTSSESKSNAMIKVLRLVSERVEYLINFKKTGKAIERERAEALKNMLSDYLIRFINVGQFAQPDLKIHIDNQISKVNQQSLNNLEAYEEIAQQFLIETERISFKSQALLQLLDSREHKLQFISNNEIKSSLDLEKLTKNYHKKFEYVLKVFKNFYDRLIYDKELIKTSEYEWNSVKCEVNNVLQMNSTEIHIFNSSTIEIKFESRGSVQVISCDKLYLLQQELQLTYGILHDYRLLAVDHLPRLGQAKKLILSKMEGLILNQNNNDAVELLDEVQFNVLLDKILYCSDPATLNHYYNEAISKLDEKATMYYRHLEEEITCLNHLISIIPKLISIVLTKFKVYLHKYNTPSNVTYDKILPLKDRAEPIKELLYWKIHFLYDCQNKMTAIPDLMMKQVHCWVDEQINVARLKYSLKMVSHSVRKERFKAARHSRLASLHLTLTRLVSHFAAVKDLIKNLLVEASQLLDKDAKNLFPFYEWANIIMQQMLESLDTDPEVKYLKFMSYKCQIMRYRVLLEESIRNTENQFEIKVINNIDDILKANACLLSDVKLFCDGGKYSAAEAIMIILQLDKANTNTILSYDNSMSFFDNLKGEILAEVDEYIKDFLSKSLKLPVGHKPEPFSKLATSKRVARFNEKDKQEIKVVDKKNTLKQNKDKKILDSVRNSNTRNKVKTNKNDQVYDKVSETIKNYNDGKKMKEELRIRNHSHASVIPKTREILLKPFDA